MINKTHRRRIPCCLNAGVEQQLRSLCLSAEKLAISFFGICDQYRSLFIRLWSQSRMSIQTLYIHTLYLMNFSETLWKHCYLRGWKAWILVRPFQPARNLAILCCFARFFWLTGGMTAVTDKISLSAKLVKKNKTKKTQNNNNKNNKII